jgi:hypothetical protein
MGERKNENKAAKGLKETRHHDVMAFAPVVKNGISFNILLPDTLTTPETRPMLLGSQSSRRVKTRFKRSDTNCGALFSRVFFSQSELAS